MTVCPVTVHQKYKSIKKNKYKVNKNRETNFLYYAHLEKTCQIRKCMNNNFVERMKFAC